MVSGQQAGEFYTPHQVSEVMAQIVAKAANIKDIYDPTVGSGSLLLTVKKHLPISSQKDLNYYGQEKNTATYNLSRMNLLLHGVKPSKMTIKNGDTLAHDWPEDPEKPNEGIQFDAVVMNPPYSLKNWNKAGLKVSDPRFEVAGTLPPDSKGDFAFLLHGFYHLGQSGTMAIVLPHGVLFRGSSEGDIRQRLIEKNHIDAVIGLPSSLFSNTGIPVCVMILKKNRALADPVLIIDASRNYIKVGKQNVLQEKDIAKIVDTYVAKKEVAGYSALATLADLKANDYNMNIPRYVEAISEDIPQDVDAHLLGGIPQKNIAQLTILHATVKDVLEQSFTEIRTGYISLNREVSELQTAVLNDERIKTKSKSLRDATVSYINKYWDVLRQVGKDTNLMDLREQMLVEIKALLHTFEHIDIYEGYQIVAEIWKNNLTRDMERIATIGFYEAGKMREKNMVKKGKDKEKVQDGWVGVIVPNELIAKNLYANELANIESLKNRTSEIDSELAELVEAAKVEDSDEYNALYESLKKNDEGEAQDSFEGKNVKAELKQAAKGSGEYDLLKKVETLMAEKTEKNKSIKAEELSLKNAVYERILVLTNDEIDALIFEKWFNNTVENMVNLVEAPLKKELKTLEMLNARYSDTLTDIEGQASELGRELGEMLSGLVVL